MNLTAPFRCEPFLRPMPWGGRRLGLRLGKRLPTEAPFGESWDVSDHASHSSCILTGPAQGLTLRRVWKENRQELAGTGGGDVFPWLIKWLDCHDWLSVQVHPDDEAAKSLWPGERGKTEAWFILEADAGARIYAGLKAGVNASTLRAAAHDGTVADCLHSFVPQPGDCVYLPAGTVHAVGGGVLMAEVQQTSDATFRLFDWNRRDAQGGMRQLHLDEALAAIHWDYGPVEPVRAIGFGQARAGSPAYRQILCAGKYFQLEYVAGSQPWTLGGDGRLQALLVIEGAGGWSQGEETLAPVRHGSYRQSHHQPFVNPPPTWVGSCVPCRNEGKDPPSMRVVVNRLAEIGRKTGVGHYTADLLRCLRQQAGKQIEGFPGGWLEQLCRAGSRLQPWLTLNRGDPSSGGHHLRGAKALSRRCKGFALEQARRVKHVLLTRELQANLHHHRIDLYHEPNFIPLPVDAPIVTTLHDLSVLLYPQWHPRDRVVYFERHFAKGVQPSQHFLAVSDFGREEIIRTLGIAPERVTRTYNGIRPGLEPMPTARVASALKDLKLPPRYLLYVGTIEPRKNLLTLLKAYVKLPDGLRRRWPLLLVGSWGWNTADIADFYHRQARHKSVLHLGYMADEHLPYLYNGARALVYPSLYEGFGMPAIEMMACGGAVLASTAGALVETVGPKAHLIDPLDMDGWHQALVRLLTDDDWLQHLRDGVEAVARPFTWERCAHATLGVYQQLTGQQRPLARAA